MNTSKLRALMHRQVDEIVDALAEMIEGAAPVKQPAKKVPRRRGPVIVMPEHREMTPERRDYAERHARRALGR